MSDHTVTPEDHNSISSATRKQLRHCLHIGTNFTNVSVHQADFISLSCYRAQGSLCDQIIAQRVRKISGAALPANSNKLLYVRGAADNPWLSVLTQGLWTVLKRLLLTSLLVTLCEVFSIPTMATLGNTSQKSPATIFTLSNPTPSQPNNL